MNKLLLNIDKQFDEFLSTIKRQDTELERLLDANFELQAQVDALEKIRHEERKAAEQIPFFPGVRRL